MEKTYRKLALALAINTVVMFFITFAMIAELGHFHANLNRFYMALLMAAPMGVVMLIVMHPMFMNRKLNAALFGLFALVILVSFAFLRGQVTIGDQQFLRSMIPHHSSAILMCERASISDPAIIRLCGQIVDAQKREIAEMEAIRQR